MQSHDGRPASRDIRSVASCTCWTRGLRRASHAAPTADQSRWSARRPARTIASSMAIAAPCAHTGPVACAASPSTTTRRGARSGPGPLRRARGTAAPPRRAPRGRRARPPAGNGRRRLRARRRRCPDRHHGCSRRRRTPRPARPGSAGRRGLHRSTPSSSRSRSAQTKRQLALVMRDGRGPRCDLFPQRRVHAVRRDHVVGQVVAAVGQHHLDPAVCTRLHSLPPTPHSTSTAAARAPRTTE